ncbi:hypothetical protein SO802_017365 [Lithocarpus litseifolius]|uniref:non-specific serine/threonine protein kinase n=1 Tax=Lithocarpus litseifolius TaxID=425828 RepID=A0AAW2CZT7_9ROSI
MPVIFSLGNSSYQHLGIRHVKVTKQPVVWVANRNDPINDSSGVLSINQFGNLVLYDSFNRLIWSTNVSVQGTTSSVVQLQDSGNLVLVQGNNKKVLWQSFDYHTDTLLPGTRLGLNRITGLDRFLTSWKSQDDSGTGDYFYKMKPTGSPQVSLGESFSSTLLPITLLLSTPLYSPPSLNFQTNHKSPRDWYLKDGSEGCVRNGEGFVKVNHLKLPDSFNAVWMDKSMTSSDLACEQACLSNCSCTAFISMNIDGKATHCLIWTMKRKLHNQVPNFIGTKDSLEDNELEDSSRHPDLLIFDISCVITATGNFSLTNKLGQGGCGSVFKGQLSNRQQIVVKRLSKNSGQGIEEFKNEVLLIAKLQHRNLVKIFGCCIQDEEKMLIYEYMPNKSLDCFIFVVDPTRNSLLDWGKCFEIIIGIARGILYLHQDSRLRIIHRDLKTNNILLDGEMNAKISDFGTAHIFKGDQIQDMTTKVVGTYGYMSPEYVIFGKYSNKSDVFSFGVMLLEIVSDKKNNDSYQNHPSLTLVGHVWERWREDRALDIVDSSINESFSSLEVLRCIQIGLLCVQEDAMDRPTMSAILLMLSSETTLPSPKQPAFIFRRATNELESITGGELYSINDMTITKFEAR